MNNIYSTLNYSQEELESRSKKMFFKRNKVVFSIILTSPSLREQTLRFFSLLTHFVFLFNRVSLTSSNSILKLTTSGTGKKEIVHHSRAAVSLRKEWEFSIFSMSSVQVNNIKLMLERQHKKNYTFSESIHENNVQLQIKRPFYFNIKIKKR